MYYYIFPIHMQLSYGVSRSESCASARPTICLAVDSRTGEVVSFAMSLGRPIIDLFSHALLLKRNEILKINRGVIRFGGCRLISAIHSDAECRKLESDVPQPLLDFRIKPKSTWVDESEIGQDFLRYLYDWSLDEFLFTQHSTCLDPGAALKLVEAAILKHNLLCLAKSRVNHAESSAMLLRNKDLSEERTKL